VPEETVEDVPAELVAVANAPYIGAFPTIASIVAVTEEDPPEEATSSLVGPGALPVLETLICTL
jgi:hypothetical protein